ncbi:signal peptidase I [Bifidobacterium sp. ESL0763]|uniref:signal peptidase I n=1 Tax=Bifidobacterium sp. ESL0763 TaxID=2983227 RepID=UPI0023F7FFDD|nr:signal peptidase I [Bifidobacterium sp. ESL0763]MDF7663383.1 signal peptidase I [Bifidobacterium sp. ESL0763]
MAGRRPGGPRSARHEAMNDSHIVDVAGYGVDPRPRAPAEDSRRGGPADDAPRRSEGKRTLGIVLVVIVVMVLLRVFVLGVYKIPSGSMRETIEIGDHVVTDRLAPGMVSLKRGDVIVFRDPAHWLAGDPERQSDDLIKRLIGLPGDSVACKGHGAPVTVNGVALDETSYIKPGGNPSDFAFKAKVSAGHVFVLGDNRSDSADSRYHADDGDGGLVPIGNVEGVAMLTIWPVGRLGVLKAHHEVFSAVPEGRV